jgi:hypothetical protein
MVFLYLTQAFGTQKAVHTNIFWFSLAQLFYVPRSLFDSSADAAEKVQFHGGILA